MEATRDDLVKIVEVMETADGGCGFCAARLLEEFVLAFPEYTEQLKEIWMASGRHQKCFI